MESLEIKGNRTKKVLFEWIEIKRNKMDIFFLHFFG